MESARCAVVFDTGSSSTRVGLSHQATPSTFPTLVSTFEDEILVGLEAKSKGIIKRVLEGMVHNWDHMQKIWEHGFKQLKVNPEDHPVVMNKSCYPGLRHHNEKTAQIMFEEFNVPALHLNYPAVLSLYASGNLNGLVVDSGFCDTQFYPVYEGHVLENALQRGLPVAGQYLTWSLCESLRKKGYNSCDYDTANYIKEKSLFVSSNLSEEEENEEKFVLPDSNTVTLSKEKYLILEEFYSPSNEWIGIHTCIFSALNRCDPALRKNLIANVVLAGGSSLFPGFATRLDTELTKAAPDFNFMQGCAPKVVALSNRHISAWIGGTILASLPTFPAMCMTREDYNEYGPVHVNTKFF